MGKKTKCKELTKILPTKCNAENEAKKVTPNVIRSKKQLPTEIANKIERAQSDQTHVVSKSNVISPSMHRSKSSVHSTPSIGPSKGKRIDSIAALIAKKKRKRLDAEKCDNLNVGMTAATPNKKRKLNSNSDTHMAQEIKVKKVNVVPLPIQMEENEKITPSKKRKKKKLKKVSTATPKSIHLKKKSSKNKKCQTVDAGVKDLKQKSNKDAHSQTNGKRN